MNEDETTCQHLKVLDERITRERELRESFEKQMDERDRRYEDRFSASEKAVYSALTAQEKLTSAAFVSSEKAIVKAEAAQISYNATHNDLTRKMDGQYKDTLPRTEAEAKFKALEEKIADLREFKSGIGGKDQNKAAVLAIAVVLIGWGITVILFLIKK